jgi:transposase
MDKFKPDTKSQLMLLPPSVEDFVPSGHLARLINEIVDTFDTQSIEDRYSSLGQKSYHPKTLLKLLIYGYSSGVVSGRKIAVKCESDTAYMYLASMYRPDFRTINDFRKDNIDYFTDCFRNVIKICKQLEMVKMGVIAVDGTKIRANASVRRTKDKNGYQSWLENIDSQIQDIISQAERVNAEEDKEHGELRGDELPEQLRDKQTLKAKIQQALNQIKDDEKRNLTDGDALLIKSHGEIKPNYNCQSGVTEDGIIVSAYVTNAASDKEQLLPLIQQAEQNTGENIINILADSGYSSYENYELLELQNKIAYIPDQEYALQSKRIQDPFDRSNFTYNAEEDKYICPQGKDLTFSWTGVHKKNKQKTKVYISKSCSGCPVKEQCTTGKNRHIYQELRESLRTKARYLLDSQEGKKLYKKRMQTIEPVWGNLKHNKKFKMFSLRGIKKVNGEFLIHCICHNINKIYKQRQQIQVTA